MTRFKNAQFVHSNEVPSKARTRKHKTTVGESAQASNPSRFSFLNPIRKYLSNLYKAPSLHPITLTALSGLAIFAFNGSMVATLAVSSSVFLHLQTRHSLYLFTNDSLIQPYISKDQRANQEGKEAGKSWTAYFKSFTSINSWKHPISFGDGLVQEMYRNTKKNR